MNIFNIRRKLIFETLRWNHLLRIQEKMLFSTGTPPRAILEGSNLLRLHPFCFFYIEALDPLLTLARLHQPADHLREKHF